MSCIYYGNSTDYAWYRWGNVPYGANSRCDQFAEEHIGVRLNPRHFSGRKYKPRRTKEMSEDRIEGFAGLTELDKARLKRAEEKRKRKAERYRKIFRRVEGEDDREDENNRS